MRVGQLDPHFNAANGQGVPGPHRIEQALPNPQQRYR